MLVIGLDAGHGGNDGGAYNKNLVQNEKTWTRKTVDKVKNILETNYNVKVIDCRPNDTNPSLKQRCINAKNGGAIYLSSLHLNAFNTLARGTEVITQASEKFAGTEAYFMNEMRDIGFTERRVYCKNLSNAQTLPKNIDSNLKFTDVYNFNDWYGICREAKKLGMSADIFEMCFIDNDEDMTLFMNNFDRICEALAKDVYAKAFALSKKDKPAEKPQEETPKPSTPSTKYSIGDVVTINGVYTSSNAETKLEPAITKGTITQIYKGTKNPYLLNNGDIGFVNDDCIIGSGASTPTLDLNEKVKIKISAKKYITGEDIPSEYKNNYYTVQEVSKDKTKALIEELYSWVYVTDLTN